MNLWIQAAAGDAGGALGIAQPIHCREHKSPGVVVPGKDSMKASYLEPAFTSDGIESYQKSVGSKYERLNDPARFDRVAGYLAADEDHRLVGAVGVHVGTREVMAAAGHHHDGRRGRVAGVREGLGPGAVHLDDPLRMLSPTRTRPATLEPSEAPGQ